MNGKRPCVALALLMVFGAGEGFAQEREPRSLELVVGRRVRVRSNEISGSLTGLATSVHENALTLSTENGPPLKLRLDSLTALDTSIGRQSQWRRGFVVGMVSGVAVGVAMPVDPNDCGVNSPNVCSRGEAMFDGIVAGGVFGAVIGALVKGDRWSPVALTLAPTGRKGDRGFGVRAELRF